MKKLFLQTFGWPLFRDCDTFRRGAGRRNGHHAGLSGVGGGVADSAINELKLFVFFAFLCLFSGCGIVPEKMSIKDTRIEPFLKAAKTFDRESYGFSPIPTEGDVRLESRPREDYDAMLHFGKTSAPQENRTIAFRKEGNGYRWIGEQEIFYGPKKYKEPIDGDRTENIALTFDAEKVSGYAINQLNVTYTGDDPRLLKGKHLEPGNFANIDGLSLEDIKPVLKEWGFSHIK